MVDSSLPNSALQKPAEEFPRDLVAFSLKAEQKRDLLYEDHPLTWYAAPLPDLPDLNRRDWFALEDLFREEEMQTIIIDITSALNILSVAPCWEDDPFDFLADYL